MNIHHAGAVLYAKEPGRVAAFYQNVNGSSRGIRFAMVMIPKATCFNFVS